MLNWLRRFLDRIGLRRRNPRDAAIAGEVKYVNLRRYLAYLEHSIEEKTQWAFFEANDSRLWSSVRREIETLLYNEWTSGALVGAKPENAFFVKCDRSTMTQSDLDNGRLVALVGVAPLRPAEFVIFRIGQWTRDKRDSEKVTTANAAAFQPFTQFNFLVEFSDGEAVGTAAGFQECSPLTSGPDSRLVTLKRGVVSGGSFERLLGGEVNRDAKVSPQTITIRSQKEDRSIGLSWRLRKARVSRIVFGPRNTQGTDVAIEELVLAYERLDDDND